MKKVSKEVFFFYARCSDYTFEEYLRAKKNEAISFSMNPSTLATWECHTCIWHVTFCSDQINTTRWANRFMPIRVKQALDQHLLVSRRNQKNIKVPSSCRKQNCTKRKKCTQIRLSRALEFRKGACLSAQ